MGESAQGNRACKVAERRPAHGGGDRIRHVVAALRDNGRGPNDHSQRFHWRSRKRICRRGVLRLRPAASAGRPRPARSETPRGRRQRPPRQDRRCPCALRVPEVMDMMGLKFRPPHLVVGADRFKAMDAQGIDMEALSINPYWYERRPRRGAKPSSSCRTRSLPRLVAAHPDRFVAFASVALQHPDLAVRAARTRRQEAGLRGVAVGGSVEGAELADPKFHPFWAKAEELGVLVFIHPTRNERARRSARRATAGSKTSSAIRSRPRSRCRT